MTATYGSIASSLKNFLVNKISGLTSSTASVGDIDYIISGLLENSDIKKGLLVDLLYSVPHVGDSGRRQADLWDTFLGGLLIIQFSGRDTTEISKSSALNTLWRAFDGGSTKILTGAAGSVSTISIGNAGTGYTNSDSLLLIGGHSDCYITIDAVDGDGAITDISVNIAGSSYEVKDNYKTTGGTGSGAKINVDSISDVGTTDRVSIIRIDTPEKTNIGEHPYYFIPFTVKVNHGGKG